MAIPVEVGDPGFIGCHRLHWVCFLAPSGVPPGPIGCVSWPQPVTARNGCVLGQGRGAGVSRPNVNGVIVRGFLPRSPLEILRVYLGCKECTWGGLPRCTLTTPDTLSPFNQPPFALLLPRVHSCVVVGWLLPVCGVWWWGGCYQPAACAAEARLPRWSTTI